MSKSQPVSEAESLTPAVPQTNAVSPLKNPSYPARVHVNERARLRDVVRSCGERLDAARKKLDVVPAGSPQRAAFERLYAQMLGACDQVADCARRIPGETGGLYEEDHHRLEEALAALDRVEARWAGQR